MTKIRVDEKFGPTKIWADIVWADKVYHFVLLFLYLCIFIFLLLLLSLHVNLLTKQIHILN